VKVNFSYNEDGTFVGELLQYNVEANGYVFEYGSLEQSMNRDLWLLYDHKWGDEPLGTVSLYNEGEKVMVEASFQLDRTEDGTYINDNAYSIYRSLKDNPKAVMGLSIGGRIINGESTVIDGKPIFKITEYDAKEVSLVIDPAFKTAMVSTVFSNKEDTTNTKINMEDDAMEIKQMEEMLANFAAKIEKKEELENVRKELGAMKENFANKTEFEALKGTIEKLDEKLNKVNAPRKEAKTEFSRKEVVTAFGKVAKELTERKATFGEILDKSLATFSDDTTTLSAAVRTAYLEKVFEIVQEANPIMGYVNFLSIDDNSFTIPKEMIGLPECGIVGETDNRTETDGIELSNVKIELYQIYAMPVVTNKLLGTNYVQLGEFLLMRVADAFNKKISDYIMSGTGTDQPLGIIKHPEIIAKAIEWNGTDTDEILLVSDELKDGYKTSGAAYIMHYKTWNVIKKMKDGQGNYIFSGSFVEGAERKINGFPVITLDSYDAIKPFADAAEDEPVVLFGNLTMGSMGIKNNKLDLTITDQVTQKGFTKFYSETGFGFAVVNPNAFLVLKKVTV
jgi:HK97 family phage major capsid protein